MKVQSPDLVRFLSRVPDPLCQYVRHLPGTQEQMANWTGGRRDSLQPPGAQWVPEQVGSRTEAWDCPGPHPTNPGVTVRAKPITGSSKRQRKGLEVPVLPQVPHILYRPATAHRCPFNWYKAAKTMARSYFSD